MPPAYLTHFLLEEVVHPSHRIIPTKKPTNTVGSFVGTPGAIRTHDLLYRKQTLYPAELRVLTTCKELILPFTIDLR